MLTLLPTVCPCRLIAFGMKSKLLGIKTLPSLASVVSPSYLLAIPAGSPGTLAVGQVSALARPRAFACTFCLTRSTCLSPLFPANSHPPFKIELKHDLEDNLLSSSPTTTSPAPTHAQTISPTVAPHATPNLYPSLWHIFSLPQVPQGANRGNEPEINHGSLYPADS